MFVGACRMELSLRDNDSLKGKRAVVRRVLDRVRSRFNTAVAEVGALDEHRRAELAFVVVSNDGRHVNSMLDEIASFAESVSEVPVGARQIEIVAFGEDPASDLGDWADFDEETG